METKEIIKKVTEFKKTILNEICNLLPNGKHEFKDPFYVHYIDGGLATTEVCKEIDVADAKSVTIHTVRDDGNKDSASGSILMKFDIKSFVDILDNLQNDLRDTWIQELRNLVSGVGGDVTFDGNFTICHNNHLLFGISLVDGKLCFDTMFEGDDYNVGEDGIPFDDLKGLLKYVKKETTQTYKVKVTISKVFDVRAHSYEEAEDIAQGKFRSDELPDGYVEENWELA